MQSSDELVTDLKTQDDDMRMEAMTKNMDRLPMNWMNLLGQRRGKHNAARAQRAKSRIAKRKSKR